MKNQIVKIILLLFTSSFFMGCEDVKDLSSNEVNGSIAVQVNAITKFSSQDYKVNSLRLDNVNIPLSYGSEKNCIRNVTPPEASLDNNRVYAYVTYSGYDINFQYYTRVSKIIFYLDKLKPGCNTIKIDSGTGSTEFNVDVMP